MKKMKAEMENLMKRTKDQPVILDFSEVTFMDSSGVGMLIGRYKTKTAYGGTIYASGLDAAIERLYRMAGLLGNGAASCISQQAISSLSRISCAMSAMRRPVSMLFFWMR